MKRKAERKGPERKKSQQVEFVSGETEVANLAAASKIDLPVAGSLPFSYLYFFGKASSNCQFHLLRTFSSILFKPIGSHFCSCKCS